MYEDSTQAPHHSIAASGAGTNTGWRFRNLGGRAMEAGTPPQYVLVPYRGVQWMPSTCGVVIRVWGLQDLVHRPGYDTLMANRAEDLGTSTPLRSPPVS